MHDEEGNLNQIENNDEKPHDKTDMIEESIDDEENNDKESEEMHFTEAYNLQDYYTFVGSNKEIINDLSDITSDSQLKENLRKSKDQLSKSDDKDGDFDAKVDGQSEIILERQEKTKYERTHTNEKPFQ